ncbi:hypothetical protein KKB69_00050 [Patescibacteria group bacterium]|nr:hypothetical protein [Patescibacteria group bacterium]
MNKITFNPATITKKLLNSLDERPRIVLVERFGLNYSRPRTLESIGQNYGITRERVRQIENFALNKIRQSNEFSNLNDVFVEIKGLIDAEGGLVQQEDFLVSKTKDQDHKNHFLFLLVAGEPFEKIKEDNHLHHSWTTNLERAGQIKNAIISFHNDMDEETVFSETEVLSLLNKYMENILREKIKEEILRSFLKVSRLVRANPLGEWGLATSPYIKPRGMRDYAFLVMRKHGSPMHFTEVAKAIQETFSRKAHIQTVHNEVIKDDKFVLVGRGLYALKEWGYQEGVVRNVIEKILSEESALPKEEIIKRVLKERYIKENTILVNLQNRNFFKKDKQGNYTLS